MIDWFKEHWHPVTWIKFVWKLLTGKRSQNNTNYTSTSAKEISSERGATQQISGSNSTQVGRDINNTNIYNNPTPAETIKMAEDIYRIAFPYAAQACEESSSNVCGFLACLNTELHKVSEVSANKVALGAS